MTKKLTVEELEKAHKTALLTCKWAVVLAIEKVLSAKPINITEYNAMISYLEDLTNA